MEFFQTIGRSIYGPDYYEELRGKPLAYSFKYFFAFAACAALILTFIASYTLIPAATSFLNSIGPKVLNYYPDELSVTLKGGKISTNVVEPYFVKIPEELKQNTDRAAGPQVPEDTENLLVIDTKADPDIQTFQKYKTLVLLTQSNVMYMDRGRFTIQPLDKAGDATISKDLVRTWVSKFQPYLGIAGPLIFIFVFVFSYAGMVFKLIYLLLLALFIWAIAKAKNAAATTYGKAYQWGLHLITAGALADIVISQIAGIKIPFLYTVVILAMAILNIRPVPPPSGESASPASN